MLMKLDEYEGNFSGFLHISKKFLGRNDILFEHPEIRRELIKEDSNGYDGQFFYFIAFDPLVRHYQITSNPSQRPIDNPAFRYRRIAYPVFTKLASGNNPFNYPAAMVLLAIAGAVLCAFFVSKTAIHSGLNGWEGLACLLIPAFWLSLSVATPEPLAAGFLAAGFYLTLTKRYVLAAILFSMAILTRESATLFVLVLAALELKTSKTYKSALILTASLLPYVAWRSYIASALFHVDGWKAFFMEPETTGVPFAGIIQMYRTLHAGTYTEELEVQAFRLPILLVIVMGVCLYTYLRTKNTVGLIGAIYAFLALSLSYKKVWIDVSNVERLSYESFLCLGLLSATRPGAGLRDARLQPDKINILIYAAFALTLIYDVFIMMRSDMFKAGFLWLLKMLTLNIYGARTSLSALRAAGLLPASGSKKKFFY